MISILLVDDEASFLEVTRMFLERGRGIRVSTATSGTQALEMLKEHKFDAIVSDYAMPSMNGIEFMKQVKAMGDDTPFVIFTGKGREDVVIDALNFGADLYLEKGADPKTQFSDMVQKIRGLVSVRSYGQVEREKCMTLFSIMGMIPGMAFRLRVRKKEALVFVSGGSESLTGHTPTDLVKGSAVTYADLIHPEDLSRVRAQRRSSLYSGNRYRIFYRLRSTDGAERRVMEEGRPLRGTDAEHADIEGYVLDLESVCGDLK